MRTQTLCLISALSILLAGCQTNNEVKVAKLPDDATQTTNLAQPVPMTAPEGDLLSLGRGMSNNSVDIYEPGTSTLDVPTIAAFSPRPSPVPENAGIIVRDPDVTVYSLDAVPGSAGYVPTALTPMPDEVVPAPRRYAGNLTPTDQKGKALPDLQPPIVAQGAYTSPFSPDGTLR